MTTAQSAGALAGIRVLDLGRFIAGPYCAALMADFGADVIRVERVAGGQDRDFMPVGDESGGALYAQMNRNKRAIALDLRAADDRPVLEELIASSDIVVANLPGSALAQLALDYDSLRRIRANIIFVNLSAYGDAGPYADRPGFDGVGQVMCGSAWLTGEDDEPVRAQVSWVDYATAVHAAFGAMVALHERGLSGQGQEVTGSLLATALAVNAPVLLEQAAVASNRQPAGNRGLFAGPSDILRTRDGWMVVQTVGDGLFRRCAELIDAPEWLHDPELADDDLRGRHGAKLGERLGVWCAGFDTEEAVARCAAAGIPAAPVLSPAEALAHPQVTAMDMIKRVSADNEEAEQLAMSAPIQLSRTPGAVTRPAPGLDQHGAELRGTTTSNQRAGDRD